MQKKHLVAHDGWSLGWICLLGLILISCGGNAERPSPTPTLASIASITVSPPNLPATSTPANETVVAPTAPPPPTQTAVPTASPSVSSAILTLSGPEDFGSDRNPLTGERVADPAVLQRRPLAIKVSNSPPSYARPQNGLSQADLVFEHVTETDITRFTAVYYSQSPLDIGPVRSARLIDKEIPAMYDAALAMSGAHPVVSQRLHGSDIGDRILRSHEPGFYRTGGDKPWEHTLHVDPQGLWRALDNYELNRPPELTAWMAFSSGPPAGGESANRIEIAYDEWTLVAWEYDVEDGRYKRWADGEPTVDANNDEQISAANVVILFAVHEEDKSICITHSGGVCSAYTLEIQLWGEGDALILRDGKQFRATWQRHNRSDMLTFVDADGRPAPLQIGNTWFQVIPHYYANPLTIE